MKTISILGSTGSVGCSTVDLIKEMRDEFVVDSLTANQNWHLLAEQAKIFKPDIVQFPYNVLDQRIESSGWLNKLNKLYLYTLIIGD